MTALYILAGIGTIVVARGFIKFVVAVNQPPSPSIFTFLRKPGSPPYSMSRPHRGCDQ